MSLLIPELVRGWCQFIPQETLAIPGKKSKGHLRLRAFILITNFRLCDGHKNISSFFDDRIFSMVFCKLFLYHYSFAFYYFCSVIRLSLQGLHPGSLSAELPRRKNLSGLQLLRQWTTMLWVGTIHRTKIVLILMYPYLYYVRLSLSGHFNEGFVKPLSI